MAAEEATPAEAADADGEMMPSFDAPDAAPPAEALKLFGQFPPELQKNKNILLVRFQAAQAVGGADYSRAIEDDIFREKWQLDSGDKGKPGITKNEAALKIAEVLHKWDKVRVAALNAEVVPNS